MALARHKGDEYTLVNFNEDAEWVLRDASGDLLVFEVSSLHPEDQVEVQCERCGRWSRRAITVGSTWVCADTGCYEAELQEGGE
jgi:hypothetical protein